MHGHPSARRHSARACTALRQISNSPASTPRRRLTSGSGLPRRTRAARAAAPSYQRNGFQMRSPPPFPERARSTSPPANTVRIPLLIANPSPTDLVDVLLPTIPSLGPPVTSPCISRLGGPPNMQEPAHKNAREWRYGHTPGQPRLGPSRWIAEKAPIHEGPPAGSGPEHTPGTEGVHIASSSRTWRRHRRWPPASPADALVRGIRSRRAPPHAL